MFIKHNKSEYKNYTRIVQWLYQLMARPGELPDFSTSFDSECEHIIPTKWTTNEGWKRNIDLDNVANNYESKLNEIIRDKKYIDAFKEIINEHENFFKKEKPRQFYSTYW